MGLSAIAAPTVVKALAEVKPKPVKHEWKQYSSSITVPVKRMTGSEINAIIDKKMRDIQKSHEKFMLSAIFDTTPLHEQLRNSGLIRNITA